MDRRSDGQTDRRSDGQTDRPKPICPLEVGGIKKKNYLVIYSSDLRLLCIHVLSMLLFGVEVEYRPCPRCSSSGHCMNTSDKVDVLYLNNTGSLAKFTRVPSGTFTLHATQCSLHFNKHQKNDIHS